MTPVLDHLRQRASALVRNRLLHEGSRCVRASGRDDAVAGGAVSRSRVPCEYVVNHNTGETISLEEARLKIGEWQPESERAELAAFLANTDPLDLRSRDFQSAESGAVSLSRGVALVPAPALAPGKPRQSAQRGPSGFQGAPA
jgi:hypothetical protein